MTLGENIKRIRQEKRLTQQQLGNLCNPPMADSAIRRYEAGKANPKIGTIQKIADALKIPISDLIPDSFDQTMQIGAELMARDYSSIEAMANHKIFTAKERAKIFQQIEKHLENLSQIEDIDKLQAYSDKSHSELENILFKMLINKPSFDTSYAVIILSCFLSLKDKDQGNIIEILLEYCYPNKDLKYWGNLADTPPNA